jgi:hypothetical protein
MARNAPLPATVEVGPITWSIELAGVVENLGQTFQERAAIVLSATVDRQVQRETLVHELFHAIHMTMGVETEARAKVHDMVSMWSPLWLDVLRRNPALVAYLLG